MPDAALMRSTVDRYITLVSTGTAEEVASLYADDATLEDPVGAEPKVGKSAIVDFYKVIEPIERKAELIWAKAAGDTAVFEFRIVTVFGETTIELQPIDIMTFDEAGKITSMRALWSAEDMVRR